MFVYLGQIYVQPDIYFNFSCIFQNYIHSILSEKIIVSDYFKEKYPDYKLMFRISAKKNIDENEIKGPSIFRKDSDMEYTIFLPFDAIMKHKNYNYIALKYLFEGIYTVFEEYHFDYSQIKENEEDTIKNILEDKKMFREDT